MDRFDKDLPTSKSKPIKSIFQYFCRFFQNFDAIFFLQFHIIFFLKVEI